MKLSPRDDLRELLRHLPPEPHERSTWKHVQKTLVNAACGAGRAIDFAVVVQLTFMLEGGECRPG
jgi:hypothetical protein